MTAALLAGALGVALAMIALVLPGVALADTTIDFEQYPANTTITNQYADVGGTGQGVVFGPLPGGTTGLDPVIQTPPAGQAQSGTNVADIGNCIGCVVPVPNTTATFAIPRSQVSVDVGYLGVPDNACVDASTGNSACAFVTLLAFDADGNQVAASPQTLVAEGDGVHTLLSVSTPSATIVGFRITARSDGSDRGKQIAIDDLTFNTPVKPPPPDFTLTPAATAVSLVPGTSSDDAIAIGRLSGSSGPVGLAVSGTLPAGVQATLQPNPAGGGSTTLTLTADPSAPPTNGTTSTITVTGSPGSAAAGSAPRSFTLSVAVKPAFSVNVSGSASVSLAQCTASLPVQVIRDLSFGGPVSLSVTGLPPGVSASFSPAQITFPRFLIAQVSVLTLTATPSGAFELRHTATISASAPPFAPTTTTFTVGGTCPLQYDAEVRSMQITQGTQLPVLPQRDPFNPGAPITYSSIGQAAQPGTQEALADLVATKPTVVRVYADLQYGPSSGMPVPAVLNGYGYDRAGNLVPLPGSPILPVSGPPTLTTSLGQLDDNTLQDSDAAAYTFTLPTSWQQRPKIELQAQLLPGQSNTLANAPLQLAQTANFPGQTSYAPCTSSACQTDGQFAISQIPFFHVRAFTIRPLAMIVTNPYDATLPDPDSVFQWAQVVTPLPLIVEPYAGTVDIGDLVGQSNSDGSVTDSMLDRVNHYVCRHSGPDGGAVIGVQQENFRSAQEEGHLCAQDLWTEDHDFAFVNAPQPLTSVSHELFHVLGRVHASPGCGATIGLGGSGSQSAEDWPPDQLGYLQSVGLAPTPTGNLFPYKVIPYTAPGASGQWYDFMSYCPFIGDGNPLGSSQNAWVSVHNWNAIVRSFEFVIGPVRDHAVRNRAVKAAAASAVPLLQVTASVDPGGHVTITDVTPVNSSLTTPSGSPYHLVAKNAAGHVTTDLPMAASSGHVDSRPPIPTLTLVGVVPASDVASVGVSSGATTLATRHKSAHAPKVRITHLPSLHGGLATVGWRATDADHDRLSVEVDYSGDGGRTWAPVFVGPNVGQTKLAARYLFRSAAARLRVIADDGFQTTTATSKQFRSPGAPPSVNIITPWPRLRQSNGAPLVLSGQAFDDRGQMLTGRRLVWMLGRRRLGTGAQITVSDLPAGTRRIELIAHDRFGRAGSASISVRLTATRPLFLKLKGPRSAGRKARSLSLTVASSLTATLVVRIAGEKAQRFTVGRRARRLKIKIVRGSKTLSLRISLGSGGLTRAAVLSVPRPAGKG